MQEDITYCANIECENISCDRNLKNIRQPIPHSFAALEGTEYCEKGERHAGIREDSGRDRASEERALV